MNKTKDNEKSKSAVKDLKLEYIIRQLSRTNRKDYENYVINTVYDRVGNFNLIPSTQHYVRIGNGRGRMIDLYFPQINIGIECLESYHHNTIQIERDSQREKEIAEVKNDDYKAIAISVSKSFAEVQNQIEECVQQIKDKIEKQKISPWNLYFETYFKDKQKICITDDIIFPSYKSICNSLFKKEYEDNYTRTRCTLKLGFLPSEKGKGYVLWCIRNISENNNAIGWNNRFEGDKLLERYNDDPKKPNSKAKEYFKNDSNSKLVTFKYDYCEKIRMWGYKFIGVYEQAKERSATGEKIYNKIKDSFKFE